VRAKQAVSRLKSSCFHFSDSGTKMRMKKVSNAGVAPSSIRMRHPENAVSQSTVPRDMPAPSSPCAMWPSSGVRPSDRKPTNM